MLLTQKRQSATLPESMKLGMVWAKHLVGEGPFGCDPRWECPFYALAKWRAGDGCSLLSLRPVHSQCQWRNNYSLYLWIWFTKSMMDFMSPTVLDTQGRLFSVSLMRILGLAVTCPQSATVDPQHLYWDFQSLHSTWKANSYVPCSHNYPEKKLLVFPMTCVQEVSPPSWDTAVSSVENQPKVVNLHLEGTFYFFRKECFLALSLLRFTYVRGM